MWRATASLFLFGTAILWGQTQPETFATTDEARDAIVQAASKGWTAVRAIFGTAAEKYLHTGDLVQDQVLLNNFNRRAAQKATVEIDPADPNRATLIVGEEEWPMAVPLLRQNGSWHFDAKEGEAEIHRRIIGGNELDTIEVCQGYVEAQKIYADFDRDGNGVPEYAQRVISRPGKTDGLYWPGVGSPIGERIAKAVAEGYSPDTGLHQPYHGYLYKILTRQGRNADDGARDFLLQGLMIGGFALAAWPAEYGVSGIKTFIVNQDGIVYEKDLGVQTPTLAKAMTAFDPDSTWDPSPVVKSDD